MANDPWPGGFFSFMFMVPMYFSYVLSSFNLYASIVTLKLILFSFTCLTGFLLYRITQKTKPQYANTVLIFTLLNPAILYINYFWVQVDILPVFFFTLGYALLRYVDFGNNSAKRYLIGFFPILISAFIYRYALILIPAIILYEHGPLKQKLTAIGFAGVLVAALFGAEFVLFRGGLYNYVDALSGSVINMSAVQGLQYWVALPQLPYLLLLGALGLALPILFKTLKYKEPAVLFFILLLFIYTSAVPLPDFFLWLYPIGVFVALQSTANISFIKKLLITNLPVFVGLFFINFIIGNGLQAGLFYFAYPLLQTNFVFVNTTQSYANLVLVFNVFLLGSVIATALFCLGRFNKQKPGESLHDDRLSFSWKFGISGRKKMFLAAVVVLLLLAGFAFNDAYSKPTAVASDQAFPLYLFPAVRSYDSSPMLGTYYLSGNSAVIHNQTEPIFFQQPLNQKKLNISLSFNLQTDQYGQYSLLKTDGVSMGLLLEPHISLNNLSIVNASSHHGFVPQTLSVPIFDGDVAVYRTGALSYVTYNFSQASLGKYYVMGFKLEGNSSSSTLLYFKDKSYVFEYNLSKTAASLRYYNYSSREWTQTWASYTYLSMDGWNILVFKPTANAFYSWVNNEPLHVNGSFFKRDINLTVGTNYNASKTALVNGYVTQLYSSALAPVPRIERSLFITNENGQTMTMPYSSNQVDIEVLTTSSYSIIQVGDYFYTTQIPDYIAFGKLTPGDYALTVSLNSMVLTQKAYGYYFVPVYLATIVPFLAVLLSFPFWLKPKAVVPKKQEQKPKGCLQTAPDSPSR